MLSGKRQSAMTPPGSACGADRRPASSSPARTVSGNPARLLRRTRIPPLRIPEGTCCVPGSARRLRRHAPGARGRGGGRGHDRDSGSGPNGCEFDRSDTLIGRDGHGGGACRAQGGAGARGGLDRHRAISPARGCARRPAGGCSSGRSAAGAVRRRRGRRWRRRLRPCPWPARWSSTIRMTTGCSG